MKSGGPKEPSFGGGQTLEFTKPQEMGGGPCAQSFTMKRGVPGGDIRKQIEPAQSSPEKRLWSGKV